MIKLQGLFAVSNIPRALTHTGLPPTSYNFATRDLQDSLNAKKEFEKISTVDGDTLIIQMRPGSRAI